MATKKAAKKAPKKSAKKAAKAPARKAPARKTSTKPAAPAQGDAAREITQRFRELGDWRGETLAKMRALILDADPEIVEEIKWRKPSNPAGVPVWSRHGMICTGEIYRDHVKLTFAEGASLRDPARIFNASMEAGTRRAVDLRAGDRVDERAFQDLVRDAIARNAMKKSRA